MEPELLEKYNRMLRHTRHFAPKLAGLHPKVAGRLGARAPGVADPYVEHLMEAFSFAVERTNIKRDRTIPAFIEQLLDNLYPDDSGLTPSISVARIWPDVDESAALAQGLRVPRGTAMRARIAPGEKTACQFTTSQDVVLYPLEIVEARLTGVPADIPRLAQHVPGPRSIRGALRLRLRTTNGAPLSSLEGLSRLPVYIAEEEAIASLLFELLHAASIASIIGEPGRFDTGQPLTVVSPDALVHEGLEPEQALLPQCVTSQHGRNLLRQYFAGPSSLYFFTLTGLETALHRISGDEMEIVVLLDQFNEELGPLVNAASMALFCTPVINLFYRHTDQNGVPTHSTEGKLGVSRLAPLDTEIFRIVRVYGRRDASAPARVFRPLYQSLNSDHGNYGRYFSMRCERRRLSDAARRHGTRSGYVGTDVFVTLVDQRELPSREENAIRFVSADVWATNRDLPLLVPRDGIDDLNADLDNEINAGIASIGLIRPPSAPQSPPDEAQRIERLIQSLNFDHQPFGEMGHREGAQALRNLLKLFLTEEDEDSARQVEGIVGVHTQPVDDVLPGNGPLVTGRGTCCVVTVDEERFSGFSPYLLGLILEHWLTRYVSINSLTRTELHSMQRGLIARWPVRMGRRANSTMSADTDVMHGWREDELPSENESVFPEPTTSRTVQWPDEPWRYGFLALMRRIGSDPAIDPVGTSALPQHEPFSLGQQPSLAFAPREVASIEEAGGLLMIRLFSLGLLGPNGPLPLHITEIARERKEHRHDATLADFLDIFHHRLLTQFYRTWAAAQSAVSLDRPEKETFSFYAASLAGHDIGETRRGALPAHALLSANAHLLREARNPDALRTTLAHYFGVPVRIEEFVFHWIERSAQDASRFGVPTTGATLGVNAFLGGMVPDRQGKFKIVLGPLDFTDYQRFTPRGTDLVKLVQWVRVFVGRELVWELELEIKPESAPVAVMGGPQQLGWSSWLGQPPADKPITGMLFEPEHYMKPIQQGTRT